MTITELQEKLIRRISKTENEETLLEIQMILDLEEPGTVEILSEEQIREIELSKEDIRKGNFITNEEADREIKEWLKNL